jgi:hypothetical protein
VPAGLLRPVFGVRVPGVDDLLLPEGVPVRCGAGWVGVVLAPGWVGLFGQGEPLGCVVDRVVAVPFPEVVVVSQHADRGVGAAAAGQHGGVAERDLLAEAAAA